nr:MAG TPA: hypothetical protein [Caudoviricetes sp.]DAQ56778.1 MAG TPA: putative AtpZ [Caudoviricetes sp.]
MKVFRINLRYYNEKVLLYPQKCCQLWMVP